MFSVHLRVVILFQFLLRNIISTESPRVCLIGAGPGGMYVLHALATMKEKMEEENDIDGLALLPNVIAFERASTPGGVWRDHDSGQNADKYRMMYNDLWTNGMKEIPEFSDYTFDEHYGGKLTPTYLTRKHLLDYILKRVTKEKNIFEEFDVRFDSEVTYVEYNDHMKKFNVTVRHNFEEETIEFDKVIWAGGIAGKANVPTDLADVLVKGKFSGAIVHSTQFDSLKESQIKGKRVVIIGDGDSSNDLAFQLIKRGVGQIFIQSRDGIGSASDVPQWPDDKVEMIWKKQLSRVTDDGSGLQFDSIIFDYHSQSYSFDVASGDSIVVSDISAVLFCTGYLPSIDFLAPYLKNVMIDQNDKWTVPKNWKMETNLMTTTLGDIVPDSILSRSSYIKKNIYRNVHIDNPNMFYIYENTNQQLFDLDVSAWLVLSYILGQAEIPSKEERMKRNQEQYLDEMQIPFLRYKLDLNYATALNHIEGPDFDDDSSDDEEQDDEHWWAERTNDKFRALVWQECEYEVRICARDMQTGGFPVSFGNYTHLNSKGIQYTKMLTDLYFGKLNIEELSSSLNDKRMTYRDLDTSSYVSIHTGKPSIPFNGFWMDVDELGCTPHDVQDCGFPHTEPFVFQNPKYFHFIQKFNDTCQNNVNLQVSENECQVCNLET